MVASFGLLVMRERLELNGCWSLRKSEVVNERGYRLECENHRRVSC